MAIQRLVLAAAAVALLSLVLNNTAAWSSSWVLQTLDGGRRRSVGLWRMCPLDSGKGADEGGMMGGPSDAGTKSGLCQGLSWGADYAGYQESRSTVKRKCAGDCACMHTHKYTDTHQGMFGHMIVQVPKCTWQ